MCIFLILKTKTTKLLKMYQSVCIMYNVMCWTITFPQIEAQVLISFHQNKPKAGICFKEAFIWGNTCTVYIYL